MATSYIIHRLDSIKNKMVGSFEFWLCLCWNLFFDCFLWFEKALGIALEEKRKEKQPPSRKRESGELLTRSRKNLLVLLLVAPRFYSSVQFSGHDPKNLLASLHDAMNVTQVTFQVKSSEFCWSA